MPNSDSINAALAALFPPQAKSCFSAALPASATLLPAELGGTEGMVEKRYNEYLHGRCCARAAMQLLGVQPQAIPKGTSRAPRWPTGLIGSITHTGGAAAAVVAKSTELTSIGLDIETREPLSAELIAMICRPEENAAQDGARAKLLFSIKEAIYKCIYPLVLQYVDFLDMQVVLDEQSRCFSAQSHTDICDALIAERLLGRYTIEDDLVICSAWIK